MACFRPFLYIENIKCRVSICCMVNSIGDYNSPEAHFDLSEDGCRKMGKWLRDNTHDEWLYSSSCDFPQEYGDEFAHLDVRELIETGYRSK